MQTETDVFFWWVAFIMSVFTVGVVVIFRLAYLIYKGLKVGIK